MLSEDRRWYVDCGVFWAKANESRFGIKFECSSRNNAEHMRMRLHKYRAMDRDLNAVELPITHPMHGVSVYDGFTVIVKANWIWIWRNEIHQAAEVMQPNQEFAEGKAANPNAIAPSEVLEEMIEEEKALKALGELLPKKEGFKRRI